MKIVFSNYFLRLASDVNENGAFSILLIKFSTKKNSLLVKLKKPYEIRNTQSNQKNVHF